MTVRRVAGVSIALGALVAGILAGASAGAGLAPVAYAVGGLGLAVAWWADGAARVAAGALACAVLGAGVSAAAEAGVRSSSLSPLIASRASVTLPGTLVSDADATGYVASAYVRVPVAGGHRTVLARASGAASSRFRVLHAGDRVVLGGRLAPLRSGGADASARRRHAVARLDDADVTAFAPPRGLFAVADALRGVVLRGLRPLPPETQALTAGFLLGDTRDVPEPVVDDYRDAGLSHLLAVSGANVAFVLALCAPLLERLRLPARTVASVGVILVFATMTRFEPSVIRASVMAAVALLAVAAGRPADRLRVLVLGVILCLLADPFLLRSAGFALSCAASAGIVVLAPVLAARLPGPRVVREPLAVSIGAQVGVVPVLLAVFGSYPVVSPVTNLAAAPAAEALGVYGLVAAVVAAAVPPVGPIVQAPTVLLVAWVSAVARAGAAVPVTLDARATAGWASIAAAAASLACLRGRRSLPRTAPR